MPVYHYENPFGYVTDLYTKSLYLQLRLESLHFVGVLLRGGYQFVKAFGPSWLTESESFSSNTV